MARVDLSGPRCLEPVPERLCGGLKPPHAPLCRRLAEHSGKHKAQRRLRGVGNTSWEWKTEKCPDCSQTPGTNSGSCEACAEHVVEVAPTFLEPQVIVRQWAPKESYVRPSCRCDGLKHKCKRYRGLFR